MTVMHAMLGNAAVAALLALLALAVGARVPLTRRSARRVAVGTPEAVTPPSSAFRCPCCRPPGTHRLPIQRPAAVSCGLPLPHLPFPGRPGQRRGIRPCVGGTDRESGPLTRRSPCGLRARRVVRLAGPNLPLPASSQRAEDARPEVADAARRTPAGIDHPPAVKAATGIASPMLWGWGRSTVVLFPRSCWPARPRSRATRCWPTNRCTSCARPLVRARVHRHRPLLVAPAVWLARAGIEVAEEECCDAWVVGGFGFASAVRALLATVDFVAELRRPCFPPGACVRTAAPVTSTADWLGSSTPNGPALPWRVHDSKWRSWLRCWSSRCCRPRRQQPPNPRPPLSSPNTHGLRRPRPRRRRSRGSRAPGPPQRRPVVGSPWWRATTRSSSAGRTGRRKHSARADRSLWHSHRTSVKVPEARQARASGRASPPPARGAWCGRGMIGVAFWPRPASRPRRGRSRIRPTALVYWSWTLPAASRYASRRPWHRWPVGPSRGRRTASPVPPTAGLLRWRAARGWTRAAGSNAGRSRSGRRSPRTRWAARGRSASRPTAAYWSSAAGTSSRGGSSRTERSPSGS
jgi:hypothetical protein